MGSDPWSAESLHQMLVLSIFASMLMNFPCRWQSDVKKTTSSELKKSWLPGFDRQIPHEHVMKSDDGDVVFCWSMTLLWHTFVTSPTTKHLTVEQSCFLFSLEGINWFQKVALYETMTTYGSQAYISSQCPTTLVGFGLSISWTLVRFGSDNCSDLIFNCAMDGQHFTRVVVHWNPSWIKG